MRTAGSDNISPRGPWTAGAAAVLLVLVACATSRGSGVARPVGPALNSVERVAPDRWNISAAGRTPERARNAAFYRGAVLAKAAGYSHLRLVSYRLEGFDYSNQQIMTKAGEVAMPTRTPENTAILLLAGVTATAAPPDCAVMAAAGLPCQNLPVDEALARLGPLLGRTPAETEAEVTTARRSAEVRRP